MAKDTNMGSDGLYVISKKQNKRTKDLLRNQMIFGTTMLEQSDQKANMLLSLSVSFLIGVLVLFLEFESYVHFPYWVLLILASGYLSTVLFILMTVKPNFRFISKLIEEEIKPVYPNHKDRTLMFSEKLSMNEMEFASDAITSDSSLQIGNMVRANYVLNKYLIPKYKCLDTAFSIFLFSMLMFFFLFMYNFIASKGEYHDHSERKAQVAYNFEKESELFYLPPELIEVSGLAYDDQQNTIYCHNDETGMVYILNPSTGKVQEQIEVSNKGDFEAIEILGDHIVISKSSGTLFGYNRITGEVEKMNTPFKSYHDVEGLHAHPTESKLLFACKGKKYFPSKADKGIYAYDYVTRTMDKEPFLEIHIKELRHFAEGIFEDRNKKHSVSQRLKTFAPSGIAIHPMTNDIYITTAKRSMLLVYDSSKQIKDIVALDPLLIPQPEGICFDPKGNLYISTEGDGGLGKLIRYDYPNNVIENK